MLRAPSGVLLVWLVVIALAVAGCAGVPTADEMKAEIANYQLPKMPEPDKALVYVVRPSSLGGLVRFNVFLDKPERQSEMGSNHGSQYIHFNVTPGEHKILSLGGNWAEVAVSVKQAKSCFWNRNRCLAR